MLRLMAQQQRMPVNRDRLLRSIGLGLILFLLAISVVGFYSQPLDSAKEASLSQIAGEITAGNVASIEVHQEELTVTLKDETQLQAQKEAGTSITETLANLGIAQEQLRDITLAVKKPSGVAFWFGALAPILLPFLLLGGFLWFMMRSAQTASNRAMTFGQMSQRPIVPGDGDKQQTTFKDVAGNKEAKTELEEVVEFLKQPKKFEKLGARIPKGVLLVGPPGTGKTLIARAVAGEAQVPFFSISGSDFVEMFVGVGASRVRDLFGKVKRHSPAILFVDELDAVGRQRGAGLGGGHDEREQTLNQILVEMDGFEQTDNVIVLAATNRPDVLDPALLRPGRFDRQVVLELPDIKEREAIMNIHAQKVPLAKTVDLRGVAERTPGFSGADLANLINEAAIYAARDDRSEVTQDDILMSIEKVLLGPEKRSKVFSEKEKQVTAYHEAGHAVVSHFMPDSDPVRKVSIVSRGHAGGYTLKLPEEDKRLHSKREFLSELATLMGGMVAELQKFDEQTTGASNDLMKATKLARRIVTEWGMSELGPVTFGQKDEYVFLGKELHEARDYSESTAAKIDEQISKLLQAAREQAEKILTKQRDKFELVAQTLLKQETLEQDEFAELMDGKPANDATSSGNSSKPGPAPAASSPHPAPA